MILKIVLLLSANTWLWWLSVLINCDYISYAPTAHAHVAPSPCYLWLISWRKIYERNYTFELWFIKCFWTRLSSIAVRSLFWIRLDTIKFLMKWWIQRSDGKQMKERVVQVQDQSQNNPPRHWICFLVCIRMLCSIYVVGYWIYCSHSELRFLFNKYKSVCRFINNTIHFRT